MFRIAAAGLYRIDLDLAAPILALNSDSASSLITPGVTRFVAEGVEQLAATVGLLDELDPKRCAAEAREPFGPAHMARECLKVYTEVVPRRRREVALDIASKRCAH